MQNQNAQNLIILSQATNSMISIALSLRIIDVNSNSSSLYGIYSNILVNQTNVIDNLLTELNANPNNWKYCFKNNLLSENVIPVIDYNTHKTMNLYDFLLTFKNNVLNI